MLAFLRRVSAFLTPEMRRALYLFLGTLGAVATGFGLASESQVSEVIAHIGHVLDFLALALAAAHVTPEGDAEGGAEE
jgi:hypothetical protein